MYILSTGCQWRALPKDLPPRRPCMITSACGTGTGSHSSLYLKCREKAAREASPTACIIDSQSVKSASHTATASIEGKKRHVLVDTQGLLLHGIVTPPTFRIATAVALLATLFGLFPFLGKLFADSAYQGPVFHRALAGILPDLETEIVKRSDRVKGFVVALGGRTHHRWLNRCRRLAKDWENLNRNALAFIKLASIRLMLRKLCLHKVPDGLSALGS